MTAVIHVEGDVAIFVIAGAAVVLTINFNIVAVDGSLLSSHADVDGLGLDEHHLLPLLLLGEHPPAHGKHSLEPFLAPGSVVAKPLDERVLHAVLNLLPPAAQSGDLGRLLEGCLMVIEWSVDNRLLNVEKVVPCDVLRDHGDGPLLWVDIGRLKNLLILHAGAQDLLQDLRHALLAGDEAFCAQDASLGVDGPADGVDGENVGGLVVPWAVFPPVGG